MTIRFKADQIHLETTEQHTLIGFAEKRDNQFEYLVLLRKFEPTDPEIEQLLTTACFWNTPMLRFVDMAASSLVI